MDPMECTVCFEIMKPPIRQCTNGHSICGTCSDPSKLKLCPVCRASMSRARNYQLEQLIEKLRIESQSKCSFSDKVCQYSLSPPKRQSHEKECKYRPFTCEGKTFCDWKCSWIGTYNEIIEHFRNSHSVLDFKGEMTKKMVLTRSSTDLKAVSFADGLHIFWYKCKVDVNTQKCFWTFQFVGLEKQAENFYYEFEASCGPIRKFKVAEICENDAKDCSQIFASEKCVVMPFNLVESYLNEHRELLFRFRIMKVKTESSVPIVSPMKQVAKPCHTSNSNYQCNVLPMPSSPNQVVGQLYYPLIQTYPGIAPSNAVEPPSPSHTASNVFYKGRYFTKRK